MSAISIQDLKVAGSELLFQEESYLDEITNEDTDLIKGGITPTWLSFAGVASAFVLSYNLSKIGAEVANKIW